MVQYACRNIKNTPLITVPWSDGSCYFHNFDKLLLSSLKLLFVKLIVNTIMIVISYSLIWIEFGSAYDMGSTEITLITIFGIIKKIIETLLFMIIYTFINSIGSENKFSFKNIMSNLFNSNLYTLIYLI